jgi:hypothetical protein|tara:strand:- start:1294 stop:1500 length:207 start_codon:yes stop_codon:yes gene_type:complete
MFAFLRHISPSDIRLDPSRALADYKGQIEFRLDLINRAGNCGGRDVQLRRRFYDAAMTQGSREILHCF